MSHVTHTNESCHTYVVKQTAYQNDWPRIVNSPARAPFKLPGFLWRRSSEILKTWHQERVGGRIMIPRAFGDHHRATPRALMCFWKQRNLCAWSLWSGHLTHTHVGGRIYIFFGLVSTIMVTLTVHWGFVNRIASLRKREMLFLNVCVWNQLDSETKLLVRCGGVSLGRRQDFCAPQARTYAPRARSFWILMGSLSYWNHVIHSVIVHWCMHESNQQLRILIVWFMNSWIHSFTFGRPRVRLFVPIHEWVPWHIWTKHVSHMTHHVTHTNETSQWDVTYTYVCVPIHHPRQTTVCVNVIYIYICTYTCIKPFFAWIWYIRIFIHVYIYVSLHYLRGY